MIILYEVSMATRSSDEDFEDIASFDTGRTEVSAKLSAVTSFNDLFCY